MLSYQHAYHAGNLADVHKHALLALALDYMAQKPKPLSYLETHAGRALYDLAAPEALKTGEAAQGIERVSGWFPADHPYARALAAARAQAGPRAYPGSPFIARHLLRESDRITLAELHPQEVAALRAALPGADVRKADGPALALSLAPPEPRRGLVLIDPSWEVKTDWSEMPRLVSRLHRKWPVGVIMLWYPMLTSGAHEPMRQALDALDIPDALVSEVRFPSARPGHGMTGSGLFVANPPWGLAEAGSQIGERFGRL
ncbi:23S rRNA (adenine(2030)-N(6))-methyltransferase RlmJ [Pseudooceanicola sp. 216_PA32_1]|uniref:Ribosomal RNA large subunit methyltransferase J n=1 Tax=Pseudooceanicola pacificus TaxID=2676438 RepID=A0A844W201_9RHOB|nr:23S rRNA (adenine(2030)-N(6))-methyltransferase RlmJ [Pseudooceanicola pacificus]MWB76714.1 23S rRNA (adenine(2030)-N(6))-methyltransferase RlmJ [Pseudooceanicola pacificus]